MRRREFMALMGGAAVGWPLATRAQQSTMPVIGWLSARSPAEAASVLQAFRQGLGQVGYFEGKNVTIEYRWAEGRYDQLPALAAELVSRQVTVIAATGGEPSPLAAKAATSTIPIVFTVVSDPIGQGFVASLAQPGGNITGFANFEPNMGAKWLQLLKELAPSAAHVSVMFNPKTSPYNALFLRSIESAASATRIAIITSRWCAATWPRSRAMRRWKPGSSAC